MTGANALAKPTPLLAVAVRLRRWQRSDDDDDDGGWGESPPPHPPLHAPPPFVVDSHIML